MINIIVSIFLIIGLSISLYFINKKPVVGILAIIFFLPFERIPSWDVPVYGGITIRLSQIFVLITLAVFVVKVFKKDIKLVFDKVTIFLGSSIFLMGLSLLVAKNLTRGLFVWSFLWFCFVTFVLFKHLIKKNDFAKIEKTIYYSVLSVCFFAFFQFFGDMLGLSTNITGLKETYTKAIMGFPRVQAFSLEPLYLANYLLLPLGLFLFLYLSGKSAMKKKHNLLIVFLVSSILTLTVSRGGLIAALFIVLASIFYGIFSRVSYRKMFLAVGAVFLGIVFGVLIISSSSYFVKRNVVSATTSLTTQVTNFEQGASVSERSEWRNAAFTGFKENPLLGVGLGNFGPWFLKYPPQTPVAGWPIVNNETLELLVETGLVGFLSFILAVFYIFKSSVINFIQSKDPYLKAFILGLLVVGIGYAIQYQAFSTLYIMHIWATIGLLVALSRAPLANEENFTENK